MSVTSPTIPSSNGEPAWEAAYMLPLQGSWSEEDFLKFHTNRMAELVDGRLEILPMPTLKHQRILRWLLGMFEGAAPVGSITLFAPLPTRLFPGTIREPDLLYIAPENAPGPDVDYPTHIDLALEIVSPGKDARQRDYEDKRADYARAGISEYWIVDPLENQVTVLVLQDSIYIDHGVFRIGDVASGLLLPALSIDVRAMLNA
ncbi:MAG TPA: Uma2 family endonuclease [Planctomycetaceae bacterium]|nr:Uma2 family endonuclease [Planctomycetaceae bacterium]HQZ68354.1 Uma2 family endonuclease [Planctomycetaceae bacterium]